MKISSLFSIAILVLMLVSSASPQGQDSLVPPPNDDFANATLLGSVGTLSATNTAATSQPSEPIHGAGTGAFNLGQNNSVWYKFVAASSGVLTFSTLPSLSGQLVNGVLSAYTGSAVNALTPVAECNDYIQSFQHCVLVFGVAAGQTYYVAADGWGSETGNFSVHYQFGTAAPNNDFINSISLANDTSSPAPGIPGSNVGATSQTGEPMHDIATAGSNNSIWYEWIAPENRSVTFTTRGSNFDTVMAVYTGSSVSNLTLVAQNDDFGSDNSSRVTFYAIGGSVYYIAIDGYWNHLGNSVLNWEPNREENSRRFDFNGDNRADVSIFRPSNGQWWVRHTTTQTVHAATFGQSGDRPTPADFTGDGKVDIAVWRPSNGTWYILRSDDNSYYALPFGTAGDIPAAGQFDRDLKADQVIFRPSTGTFYVNRSRSPVGVDIHQFGTSGDVPAIADYDGDGRSDIAIYRPSNGQWWVKRSKLGVWATTFGSAGDKPVIGDYTGDGRTDVAFWRPTTGEWFILRSEDDSFYSVPFGAPGDIPVPGDYNADRRFDTAVFRPSTGGWWGNAGGGGIQFDSFGVAGDIPIASSYVP